MASAPTNLSDEALLLHNTINEDMTNANTHSDNMPIADNRSETSTVKYEWDNHESFTTYKNKILEDAAKHLNCLEDDIKIEHMKGGTYNRVAAISVPKAQRKLSLQWLKSQVVSCLGRRSSSHKQYEEYVMRVPRDHDYTDITGNVALLQFVGHYLTLPVPEIVAFDLSKNNALKQQHMLIKRLKGDILYRMWPSLNVEQKRSVINQVAQLVPKIAASFQGPPGDLSEANLSTPKGSQVIIKKFFRDDFQEIISPPDQTCLEHILELIEFNREHSPHRSVFWDSFTKIANSLQNRGFLDGPAVLTHNDLGPHNILAKINSSTSVTITGIIDWDLAIISPRVTAYRTPCWMWAASLDGSQAGEENRLAPTPEHQALKDFFLANISEHDKKFYFAPEALLARKFYHLVKDGIPDDRATIQAQNVVSEWADRFSEDGVEKVHYVDAEEYANRTYDGSDFEIGDGEDDEEDNEHNEDSDSDSHPEYEEQVEAPAATGTATSKV